MRGLTRIVAGVVIAMATVAMAPSALAQEQGSPRAGTLRFSETGPDAESPRTGADAPPARGAQAPTEPPTVEITDGTFTDDDPEVTFEVSNCASNSVTAESPIFASFSYAPDTRTGTADIRQGTESGTYPLTITCQGQPPSEGELTVNAGASDDGEISARITDGTFTDEDPEIRIEVTGCESDEVTADSPIFASSSYDEDTGVVTARIEEGTESGSYDLTVTCEGQPTLEGEIEINAGGTGGGGGGSDGGSTPRGGVDTGYGGTADGSPPGADGSPAAGWLLVPLLGATGAGLIVLRRRHASDR